MELLLEILREHKIFRRVCETRLPPPPKNEEEKQCSGLCRKFKPPEEFPMKRGNRDSVCLACRRQQHRMYYVARKEEPDEYERGPKGGRPGAAIVDGRKRCSGRCGQWLPADTEHFHANGIRGLKARCKECTNKSERATRAIINGRMRCVGPCGKWLPADTDHFGLEKKGRYFRSRCKQCMNKANRQAYRTRVSTINSARKAARRGETHDTETTHDDMAAQA